jgi:hypothetical protein
LRDLRVFNAEGEAQAHALTPGSARQAETHNDTVKWFLLYPLNAEQTPSVRAAQPSGTLVEVKSEGGERWRVMVLRGYRIPAIDASISWFSTERRMAEGFRAFH